MADDHTSRERATARGERIRAALLAKLRKDGPRTAAALAPHLPPEVSLSEVAFQLDRLADEDQAVGEQGGVYRLR